MTIATNIKKVKVFHKDCGGDIEVFHISKEFIPKARCKKCGKYLEVIYF